jgi:hypothetical protein
VIFHAEEAGGVGERQEAARRVVVTRSGIGLGGDRIDMRRIHVQESSRVSLSTGPGGCVKGGPRKTQTQ